MIVLGKDKTLDNYFIDENGVITDLNGNVQELKIHQGYLEFKHIGVHKIQIWSNFGYRDTKIWVIHHLDENKQNNVLSNLVYLTRSEHRKLHNKGKKYALGYHHSKEVKKRMSENHVGFIGKKHSGETKRRMSKAIKGLRWFNDGVKNYRCKECPPGCVKGRLF